MTRAQPSARSAPLDLLLAEEWALTFPDIELARLVNLGRHALEVAGDSKIAPARREFAREIGAGVSKWLVSLIDSARARQGHGHGAGAHGMMSAVSKE